MKRFVKLRTVRCENKMTGCCYYCVNYIYNMILDKGHCIVDNQHRKPDDVCELFQFDNGELDDVE